MLLYWEGGPWTVTVVNILLIVTNNSLHKAKNTHNYKATESVCKYYPPPFLLCYKYMWSGLSLRLSILNICLIW